MTTMFDARSRAFNLLKTFRLSGDEAMVAAMVSAARDAIAAAYMEGKASSGGIPEAARAAAPAMRHVIRCYEQRALPCALDVAFLQHVLDAIAKMEEAPPKIEAPSMDPQMVERIVERAQTEFVIALRSMLERSAPLHAFDIGLGPTEPVSLLLVCRPRQEVERLFDGLAMAINLRDVLDIVQEVLRAHGAKKLEPEATFEAVGLSFGDIVRILEEELPPMKIDVSGEPAPKTIGDVVARIVSKPPPAPEEN